MSPHYHLFRLRDIGWSLWDPIGLKAVRSDCADEYDSYLLQAFECLTRGDPVLDVVRDLVRIEAEFMGLGERACSLSRAMATVEAINDYIRSIPR